MVKLDKITTKLSNLLHFKVRVFVYMDNKFEKIRTNIRKMFVIYEENVYSKSKLISY